MDLIKPMAHQFPQKENNNSSLAFVLLFLYTAAVLIRPHEMFVGTREWIVIKILAILCFLATLIGQRPIKIHPQHWMLLALAPLIILSGFFNNSGMTGLDEAIDLFASSLIPLFLYTTCITSVKRQHALMYICLIAALIMVHNGHVQQTAYMGDGWALYSHSVGRIDLGERRITYLGFFSDPNDIGMLLVMCIPFTVYFFKSGKTLIKLSMILSFSALLYGIYLTGSRGTMLGAGSLVGVYFLVAYAGPKLFISSLILAPIAATVVTSLQSNIDDSANSRLEAWYHGIQMMFANPVFGVGKSNFVEVHGLVAHNSYIHILGELGIPGYSLWGGALVFTVIVSYSFIKFKNKDKKEDKFDNLSVPNRRSSNLASTKNEKRLKLDGETLNREYALNQTLFFSMVGFMVTAFFLSKTFHLLLFIFIGMTLASHIRLVRLEPKLEKFFNTNIAIRSMLYCWVVIVAVYITLKMGL
ncbi:O-antigen ligase [Colwellia sp. BRX8-7]|uniref:O-antigen ligase family protein n=1 Tax=Colwellia sp. BRX8-7 TaxID=2759833 RepID=UPI0021750E8B|nr:O-antigen ligase family protein [Colwellia sp. BRX8-7]